MQTNDDLNTHLAACRTALRLRDATSVASERSWFAVAVAEAVAAQDFHRLNELRSGLSELALLAGRSGIAGDSGECWRAFAEVLGVAVQAALPREQARLLEPGMLSGRVFRHIERHRGAAHKDLTKAFGKEAKVMQAELKHLESVGMIVRQSRAEGVFFVPVEGASGRAAPTTAPSTVKALSIKPVIENLVHADVERMARLADFGIDKVWQSYVMPCAAQGGH